MDVAVCGVVVEAHASAAIGSVAPWNRSKLLGQVRGRDFAVGVASVEPGQHPIEGLSEFGVSHLADNVVVLQYVHSGSSIDRTLAVLKTRASTHDPAVRTFEITLEGIRIADDASAPGS